jgi:hypothetical protein
MHIVSNQRRGLASLPQRIDRPHDTEPEKETDCPLEKSCPGHRMGKSERPSTALA